MSECCQLTIVHGCILHSGARGNARGHPPGTGYRGHKTVRLTDASGQARMRAKGRGVGLAREPSTSGQGAKHTPD